VIDCCGRQRKWHRGISCGFWILNDDDTAGVLHVDRARGAIRAGTGQNHRDQVFAISLRCTRQKHIYRRFGTIGVIGFEMYVAVPDSYVPVRRHYIYFASLQSCRRVFADHDDR
jgi:hypothetical protein